MITQKDEIGARSGWFELGSKNPIPDQQNLLSFSYAGDAKVPFGWIHANYISEIQLGKKLIKLGIL